MWRHRHRNHTDRQLGIAAGMSAADRLLQPQGRGRRQSGRRAQSLPIVYLFQLLAMLSVPVIVLLLLIDVVIRVNTPH